MGFGEPRIEGTINNNHNNKYGDGGGRGCMNPQSSQVIENEIKKRKTKQLCAPSRALTQDPQIRSPALYHQSKTAKCDMGILQNI